MSPHSQTIIQLYIKVLLAEQSESDDHRHRTFLNRDASSMMYLVWLVLLLPACLATDEPELTTTLGEIKGFRQDAGDDLSVDIYYGIPFAKPPVGDLRFKAPEPPEPWSDTRDGTILPNSCWQVIDTAYHRFWGVEMWNPNTERSEDCLYLNVYIPNGGSERKTIMVWIFGGGFWAGTNTLEVYNATQLAARNDVIVVNINQRVGAFGYLYQANEDAPGNAGLLDQHLAIKWVKENAENMGGNPDDITLFGESSGAVSIGFHMMSPMSRDLFKNAIMESSSPLCDWGLQTHQTAFKRADILATAVNCSTGDEMITCLRQVDPDTLATKQWNVVEKWFDVPFAPVIDGKFLPDWPSHMVAAGDIKRTNLLIGMNKNEGIYFDIYGFMDDFPLDGGGKLTQEQFNEVLKDIIPYSDISQKVKSMYFKDTSLDYEGIIDAVSGDQLFKCPVIEFAELYSLIGDNVYMYYFDHRMSDVPWPEWMGVPHGYEVEVVFGLPLANDANVTAEEKEFTKRIMGYWTRFAATGDPNPDDSYEWPEFSEPEEKYIHLDLTYPPKVSKRPRHRECKFWLQYSTWDTLKDALGEME